MKKLNNYDNTIKSAPRSIVEQYDLSKYYHQKNTSSQLGHAFGPGGRAVLYATAEKKKEADRTDSAQMGRKKSKINDRNRQISAMKSWNHYD